MRTFAELPRFLGRNAQLLRGVAVEFRVTTFLLEWLASLLGFV